MRASPTEIVWMQRALRHEFAAARQFTLQAALAQRLGDAALAAQCERAALDEWGHARRLASALADTGGAFAEGAPQLLPVGNDACSLLAHAVETERRAVDLYRRAAHAARGDVRALFDELGADEAQHLRQLQAQLRRLD